jgi:hypothetical protein
LQVSAQGSWDLEDRPAFCQGGDLERTKPTKKTQIFLVAGATKCYVLLLLFSSSSAPNNPGSVETNRSASHTTVPPGQAMAK